VRLVFGIQQDSRDQESRQDKKQVDPANSKLEELNKSFTAHGGTSFGDAKAIQGDHQDSNPADAIKRRNVPSHIDRADGPMFFN
jgi:hypothetical protein